MGQHTWLLLATICTELLAIRKWSRGMFTEPFPFYVKLGWSIGAVILTVYPIVRVSGRLPLIVRPLMTELNLASLVWNSSGQEVHPQTTEKERQTQSSLAGDSDDRNPYTYVTGSGWQIQFTSHALTCTTIRTDTRVPLS